MFIFLDDEREPAFIGLQVKDCIVCRTAEEAIALLKTNAVLGISFDHDLGTETTGYTVAVWIEEACANDELTCFPKWSIHSANPVGRRNIEAAMESAQRFYDFWED